MKSKEEELIEKLKKSENPFHKILGTNMERISELEKEISELNTWTIKMFKSVNNDIGIIMEKLDEIFNETSEK